LKKRGARPRIAEVNARVGTLNIAHDLGPGIAHAQTAAVEVVIAKDVECRVAQKNVHDEGIRFGRADGSRGVCLDAV